MWVVKFVFILKAEETGEAMHVVFTPSMGDNRVTY